jgi:hypothetical protein
MTTAEKIRLEELRRIRRESMNPENDPVFGNSKPGDESSDGSEADKRANKTVHDKLHE